MGTNKANPSAMILSSTMMLRHLGLEQQANLIAAATYEVIKEGKVRTADMNGEFILRYFPFRMAMESIDLGRFVWSVDGLRDAGCRMEENVILVTRDSRADVLISGSASTSDFTKAVIDKVMA